MFTIFIYFHGKSHTFVVAVAISCIAAITFVVASTAIIVATTCIFISISPVAVSDTPFVKRIAAAEMSELRKKVVVKGVKIGIVETFLAFGSRPIAEQGSFF